MAITKTAIEVPKTTQIRLRDLPPCLERAYKAGRKPVMIWGSPGMAKSAHAQQFAKKMNLPFVDIRLAHYDPVDFKGIPHIDIVDAPAGTNLPNAFSVQNENGDIVRKIKVTRFAPPEFLPMSPAIICMDELPNALPSIQIVASRITLDRTMDGGWEAHPDTMIVATGNRRTDRAGANALLMNLDNRMTHFEVQQDVEYWLDWVLKNYSDNEFSRRATSNLIPFIKFAPQLSYQFEPESSFTDAHGYPTYRSWAMTLDYMASCYQDGYSEIDSHTRLNISGTVGIAASEQFFKFLEIQKNLPNVDKILGSSDNKFELPDKLDIMYAFVGAIAFRTTPKTQSRVWEITEMLETKEKGEWSMLLCRLAARFCSAYRDNKKLRDYVSRHKYIFGL
jgi:hypothetical protein